jgi:hypothetical protein
MSGHDAMLGLLIASIDLLLATGERITPDRMDDPPVYPAVTFQKMGGRAERGATSNPGLMRDSFQVSTWAESRSDAVRIAGLVKKACDRRRNLGAGNVVIKGCFYESDHDTEDPDTGICVNHMSFTLHYQELS